VLDPLEVEIHLELAEDLLLALDQRGRERLGGGWRPADAPPAFRGADHGHQLELRPPMTGEDDAVLCGAFASVGPVYADDDCRYLPIHALTIQPLSRATSGAGALPPTRRARRSHRRRSPRAR